MQPAGWTILDHTADTGLEVRAPTASSLFETAACGLFSLITDPSTVVAREPRRIEVSGGDPGQLMVRWLSELLYLQETEGMLFSRFEVEGLEGDRVRGTAWGRSSMPAAMPSGRLSRPSPFTSWKSVPTRRPRGAGGHG